ncbi:SecD/SecF fusion protein [Clostridiales Family XIII bacterium PM5-7]
MSLKLKKILACITIIATVAGWYVTVFGVGSLNSIKDAMKFGLDINGGVYVVLEADTDATGQELTELMEQTREVLNNRVNAMGISEATVSIEGKDRLRVEMPGVENAQEAIDQIGRTAQLRFFLADGTEVLSGTEVKDASIDTDTEQGGYKVLLQFSKEGSEKFADATEKASSGQISIAPQFENTEVQASSVVIMLDDEIITAPRASQKIDSDSCEISPFTKEGASTTAALIRGGALPVALEEMTSSVQTATIGVDALNKSVIAGVIGLALVFILMIAMYKILGVIANLALLLYVLIVLWIMVGMGSVLTLPGIAGIILSIGMAVDANVIIFSRIKDEIGMGKSIRVAVDQGFKHALTTVLDAQITTLIAAVVLYEIGATVVKGFALTLMIGIIVSIFTAVVVTQLYMGILSENKKFAQLKHFGINEDGTPKRLVKKDFQFIKNRKIFYIISTVILVAGLASGVIRGFNTGIDFTGGTMLQIDMGKTVEVEKVEESLKEFDMNPSIVLGGDDQDQIIIKTKKALTNEGRTAVIETLGKDFGVSQDDVLASEEFGPTVGSELTSNAIKSVLIASVGMLLYIIFRFKSWKYGIASLAGVFHDVFVLLSIYTIFGITVNNPFIAGILTVVGYSINDTIVIFDRIRENRRLTKKDSLENIMDLSLNQTLSRSIMTSLTTMICMIPLLIMVSSSIREFVIPLMIGVIAGAYSSIFTCSPLLFDLSKKENQSKYLTTNKNNQKKK